MTPVTVCSGRVLGPVIEEGDQPQGRRWTVCVIQEGLSRNRTLYTADVLRAAVPLYEGTRVFWNHTKGPGERDARDLAGFLSAPSYSLVQSEGQGIPSTGMVSAILTVTSKHLREQLLEAHEAGRPDLLGLSHTVSADSEVVRLMDGTVRRIKAINAVESVDVVAFPSAGGRVLRLVAGLASPVETTTEDLVMFEKMLAGLRATRPDLAARLPQEPTEADIQGLLLEAIVTPGTTTSTASTVLATVPTASVAPVPAPAGPSYSLTEADRRALRELRVDRALKGRTLPEPMVDMVRESLLGRDDLTDQIALAEVDRVVKVAAMLAERRPTGSGLGQTIEITHDEVDKIQEMTDGWWMGGAAPEVRAQYKVLVGRECPPDTVRGLRRLYTVTTGDEHVTGVPNATHYHRLMEAVRIKEAITSSSLTNLWATSINRRLLSEYRSVNYSTMWRRLVSRVIDLPDYKAQTRLRWGGFANLATVQELQPYPELAAPTDQAVTYTPSKRGGIVSISREAIKNDDVGAVRDIPRKLGIAAARTLFQYVMDMITTNPTLDDGVALFAASTARGATAAGNLQTAALSATTVGIAWQRMLTVTDIDARTTLAISPSILIVPPGLAETGWRLTSMNMAVTSNQNATEPNIVRDLMGLNQLFVNPMATDANDYFIMADPAQVDTIELGFLDGQQEPQVFVQNDETVGSVFSADKISWKVRHEYGGDVIDWRGFQGGIVA